MIGFEIIADGHIVAAVAATDDTLGGLGAVSALWGEVAELAAAHAAIDVRIAVAVTFDGLSQEDLSYLTTNFHGGCVMRSLQDEPWILLDWDSYPSLEQLEAFVAQGMCLRHRKLHGAMQVRPIALDLGKSVEVAVARELERLTRATEQVHAKLDPRRDSCPVTAEIPLSTGKLVIVGGYRHAAVLCPSTTPRTDALLNELRTVSEATIAAAVAAALPAQFGSAAIASDAN